MLRSGAARLDRMSKPSTPSAWIAGSSPAMTKEGEEPRMPRTPRIAIVGGGIGGLAAALALERRGAEVIVCEQASVLSEIGAGVNLTPNAVKAFRALGLDAGIEDIGWAPALRPI